MKKIIICANTSWSIYNFRLNLAKRLKNEGYEVIIVSPYDKYSEILKENFSYYDIYIDNKGANPINDLKTLFQFYKLYRDIKPSLILHYTIKPNIYGTLAGKLNNIESIAITTGLGYTFINENLISKIVKKLYKFSLKFSHEIWFLNDEDRDIFINEGLVSLEKSFILHSEGVDTDKFKPIDNKKNNNIFKFLLISRMLWDKGIGDYVDAAKIIKSKYKNIEFQLLGFLNVENNSAISEEQIQEWVDNKIVIYLGVTDNVDKYIQEVDCIVLPSFYREGVPRVLLESASMEKPIITTNSVGCRDVVDDNINGYLCEVRNIKDLVLKMEMMLKLSDLERATMGRSGREKIITEFSENLIIDKYLNKIREILI